MSLYVKILHNRMHALGHASVGIIVALTFTNNIMLHVLCALWSLVPDLFWVAADLYNLRSIRAVGSKEAEELRPSWVQRVHDSTLSNIFMLHGVLDNIEDDLKYSIPFIACAVAFYVIKATW